MAEKTESMIGYFLSGLAIGSLIAIFFAPKSGEATREYLSQKVDQGSTHAQKKARELRERAEDLVEFWKELVNQKKATIAAELDEAGNAHLPEKAKAV